MAAKTVLTSRDGIIWNTLAGNDASIELNGAELDNTTFGSDFSSNITGIIEHTLSSNVVFRRTAGFEARLRIAENSTPFTEEATSLVDGWYVITNRARSLWNLEEGVIFADGDGVIDSDDIAAIDYLNGRVRFVSGFTPDGAVTVDGEFLTTVNFGCANSIDLSQSMETIETGCFETVGENGGFQLYEGTLRSVSLDLDAFYRESNDFYQILLDRDDIILEIDLDGTGTSVARGYFKVMSDSLSGGVGGDETESVSLGLSVPLDAVPFSWYFAESSNAPESFKDVIWAWENKKPLKVRYFPKGVEGRGFQGDYIVTDSSVSVAIDTIGEASVSGQGTGAITVIND